MTKQVAILLFVALTARSIALAQEEIPAACSVRFDQHEPAAQRTFTSPAQLCDALNASGGDEPFRCDRWQKVTSTLELWRAQHSIEGESLYVVSKRGDAWHTGEPIWTGWTTPGGGVSVKYAGSTRRVWSNHEVITLSLQLHGFDPDHGQEPTEMEEHSNETIVCVRPPPAEDADTKCLTLVTRRRGAWYDLKLRKDGDFDRLRAQSPWHAAARYWIRRDGTLEIKKIKGEWKTLEGFSAVFAGALDEACESVRVRLW